MNKKEFLAFSLPFGLKVYDCINNSIEALDYSKGCPKCVSNWRFILTKWQ